MDLIYTNAKREDLGVLLDYELDLAFGEDENDFECQIQADQHCCEDGSFLYIEGTEYGGIVDSIEVDTAANEVTYRGRTWHGILGSKVIIPLKTGEGSTASVTVKTADSSGASLVDKYLVISGDANRCIDFIINRCGLESLFMASSALAGVNINYQFNRYTDAYSGLVKMLSSAGLKLCVEVKNGQAVLSSEAKYNYATDDEFDSDLVEFKLRKNYKAVNHLICLGSGELENRMIVHLYADSSGNISQMKTATGLNEYAAVFDYSSAESEEELIKSGTEQLQKLWEPADLSIDFDANSDSYDVGDIVGAIDNITGITVSAAISKKIVTIKKGQTTISYKVGE